jgi:hypothetical protein
MNASTSNYNYYPLLRQSSDKLWIEQSVNYSLGNGAHLAINFRFLKPTLIVGCELNQLVVRGEMRKTNYTRTKEKAQTERKITANFIQLRVQNNTTFTPIAIHNTHIDIRNAHDSTGRNYYVGFLT